MTVVLFKTYDQLALAELEHDLLNAQGIKCMVKRSDFDMIDGGLGGRAGIYVQEADLQKAKEILAND